MTAVISDCGQYRYVLTRPSYPWHAANWPALFIMLNPSTADATVDDPTIRRCRTFAADWLCGGLTVANLYALRSTNPNVLRNHPDPVGPENDAWLMRLLSAHGVVVCAWGANADPARAQQVVTMLQGAGAKLMCLGTTLSGAPKHPLYVRRSQQLMDYRP